MIALHVVTGMDGQTAVDVYHGDSLVAAAIVPRDGAISFVATTSGIVVAGYRPMSVPIPPDETRHPPRERLSWWDRLVAWVRSIGW